MKKGIVFEINNNRAVIITPEGEFLSIPSDASWQIGSEVSFNQNKLHLSDAKRKNIRHGITLKRAFLTAVAACLIFFVVPLTSTSKASTFISIDINPSIELELKDLEVVNITPLNQDAEKVIELISDDIIGADLYKSTIQILEVTQKLGYLKKESNLIVVGVYDKNKNIQSEEYKNFIIKNLAHNKKEVEVVIVSGTNEDKKNADKKEISIGKYVIQKDKKNIDVETSGDKLKNGKIKEIIKKTDEDIKEKNKGNINNKDNDSKKSSGDIDSSNNSSYKNNNHKINDNNQTIKNSNRDKTGNSNQIIKNNTSGKAENRDKSKNNNRGNYGDKGINNPETKEDKDLNVDIPTDTEFDKSNNSGNDKDKKLNNESNINSNSSVDNKQNKNEFKGNSQKSNKKSKK